MSLLFTIFPHVVWALYFLYRITTANPFAPKLPAQHPSFSILKLVILGFLPLPVFFLIATFSLPLLVSYTVAALLALRHTLSAPLLNFVDHLSHRHYLRLLLWRIDVLAYVLYISVTSFFSSPSFLLLLYSSFLFFGSCITSLTDLYARSRHEAPDQTLATMIRLAFVRAPSLPYSPLAPANIRDASAFSLLTFEWVTPTVATGRRRSLEIEDVKSLSQKFSCYAASNDRFVPSWREELDSRHRRDPSLFRALFKAFGLRLMIGGSLKLVNDVAIFIAPMTLRVVCYSSLNPTIMVSITKRF